MELWDVYDQDGNRQEGALVRGEPIPAGKFHLVCCVIVRHENGDYLLMLRSPKKEVHPNVWEIGAGGSALQGEDSLTCARRELEEETGIADGEMTFTGRYVDPSNGTIYDGYLCATSSRSVRLQEGETVDYRWISQQELIAFCNSDACVPRQRRRMEAYLKTL